MALLTNSWKTDTLTVFIGILTVTYLLLKRCYSYWDRKGFKTIRGTNFLLGHFKMLFSDRLSLPDFIQKLYKSSNEPFEGIYGITRPLLFVRDPELIRSILITDFSNFTDRGIHYDEKNDPLSGNLFCLPGQKWKTLRGKLSPTFTSAKLKSMFSTLVDCGSTLQAYLDQFPDTDQLLDVREISACYATNCIASVAFGIEVDTINNPDNEFRVCGRKITEPNFWNAIRGIIAAIQPKMFRILRMRSLDKQVEEFVMSMVKQNVDYRERNNITRKDLFQSLIQLRNNGAVQLDDEWGTVLKADESQKSMSLNEIAAQTFIFFIGGFDSSSSTLTFCLYELSRDQNIQRRVHDEIDEVLKKHDGKITYDSISDMKYLDACIDETLRKYTAVSFLTRKCMNDYRIPGTNQILEKGVEIMIPVFGLQRDEKYYDEPDKFKPERFFDENLTNKNCTYLPFGDGPRNCIAKRLGKMQTKVGLVSMLQHFKYELEDRLKKSEIQFDRASFTTSPIGGIHLHVKRR